MLCGFRFICVIDFYIFFYFFGNFSCGFFSYSLGLGSLILVLEGDCEFSDGE